MGRPSKLDREFRAHAVELIPVSSRVRTQISHYFGVSTTLVKWMDPNTELLLRGTPRRQSTGNSCALRSSRGRPGE